MGVTIANYAIKDPKIHNPVPVHEVLPLPVVITQDHINKRKYFVESKWFGTLDSDEEVFAIFHCENGAKASQFNVTKSFSDFKHTFEVIVPKKSQIVTCRRGIFDIDSFRFFFKFEHKE
ncbi:hypothetical protein F8M41_005525 [Gigaspora margarita]|uniref:Uncharacterized protein n=1 Tax=Gigaspora margarita TaxID=4874 RepID=A0A8H4AXA1_GIGMA|nr:hypothetical protein F8M41_005525 [Gigaspora margarita]